MRSTAVPLLALATLLAAGCDDDGTSSRRLTSGEVAGVYRVCVLRFVPTNSVLPPANLLGRVVDATPPAGKPEPTLTLSPSSNAYQLIYTSESDAFTEELRGSVAYGEDAVFPRFYSDDDSRGDIATDLLLPARSTLSFQTGPKRLSTSGGDLPHLVSRRAYATAANISESGLSSSIEGRMEISLREGSCS
jgi:hypothetical protein